MSLDNQEVVGVGVENETRLVVLALADNRDWDDHDAKSDGRLTAFLTLRYPASSSHR
jgi:hypothetical protein